MTSALCHFQKIADPQQIASLKGRADEVLDEAVDLINSSDGWKSVKEEPSEGATMFAKRLSKGSKRIAYKIQGPIKMSASEFREKFFSEESWNTMPSWNAMVKESTFLQDLGDGVFITYQSIKPMGPGGMVSSRDFVYLRKERKFGDGSVCVCYETVKLDLFPPLKDVVRADCFPSGVKIEPWTSPSEDDSQSDELCLLTWVVDMDLKVPLIPETLFNQIFQHTSFNNFKDIRKRAAQLKLEKTE